MIQSCLLFKNDQNRSFRSHIPDHKQNNLSPRMNLENLLLSLPAAGVLLCFSPGGKLKPLMQPQKVRNMSKSLEVYRKVQWPFPCRISNSDHFRAAVAVLLYWSGSNNEQSHALVAVSFAVGAFCSALAGYLGMKVATKAMLEPLMRPKTVWAKR